MYNDFLNDYCARISPVLGQASFGKYPAGLHVVLTDLVLPETRSRKPMIEFPLAVDVLGQALERAGNRVDYTFLPPNPVRFWMRKHGQPLLSLGVLGRPRMPVADAAVLGITMMNYLQTPQFFMLLSLAHIPFLREERSAAHPLVVLGGHVWPNPLPLSDFYDVMVAGDGEDVLADIAQKAYAFRGNRQEMLSAIAEIKGAYVPGYTHGAVERSFIDFADTKNAPGSSLLLDGTGGLLLSRGCPHHCAFCMSSHIDGAFRIKPFFQIAAHLDRLAGAGAKRVILCSSAAGYYKSEGRGYGDVVREIRRRSLTARSMSNRPETFDAAVLEILKDGSDKVTIALEGHPYMRRMVFNKHLDQGAVERAIDECIKAGISRLQLYVILAVPAISAGMVPHLPGGYGGETEIDIRYMADFGMMTLDRIERAKIPIAQNKPCITFDCMPLVPAPGTPLETVAFPAWEKYWASMKRLSAAIATEYRPRIRITAGLDPLSHLLQALLERGTAKAGQIVLSACRKAEFEIPGVDLVESAMAEYGVDSGSLFEEVPADKLPYAGLIKTQG
jgi:hypothetical protein